MNYKNIIPIIAAALLFFTSCRDQIMEWEKDPSKGEITESEIPLELWEKIAKYDALNSYTDLILGTGIGMDLYMNNETYHDLAVENFDDLTVGYAMKHGPMVNNEGIIQFDAVDAFMTKAKEDGMSVYGHTLVWHQNQNAGYLNSIIAGSGNLIKNGNFETGDLTGWSGWGDNSPTTEISADGEGFGGTGYAMKLINPVSSDFWKAQQMYEISLPLKLDTEYTIMFKVKADVDSALIQVEMQNADYNADYTDIVAATTDWTTAVLYLTPTKEDRTRFIFDYGKTAATFYIDDIVLIEGTFTENDTIETTDKTPEEKTQIIGDAMETWITDMVTHYKADIKAWDVVNEAMKENGEVRDGNIPDEDLASDEFYWQKYLGDDYAVTAFNLARQHGNADDKLFINDYNLESNMTKLDGLIDYVEYIESKGATIDGIGTQMHISYNSDTALIEQMFQKLAATGKLIKVTELDIRLGTSTPTSDLLEAQADMYRFVIDMYKKYIPEAQQYSITIWGISDNEDEHEYWLPEESPNLWDANYERKHAYMGAANGFAGYDVSEDFTGDLDF